MLRTQPAPKREVNIDNVAACFYAGRTRRKIETQSHRYCTFLLSILSVLIRAFVHRVTNGLGSVNWRNAGLKRAASGKGHALPVRFPPQRRDFEEWRRLRIFSVSPLLRNGKRPRGHSRGVLTAVNMLRPSENRADAMGKYRDGTGELTRPWKEKGRGTKGKREYTRPTRRAQWFAAEHRFPR